MEGFSHPNSLIMNFFPHSKWKRSNNKVPNLHTRWINRIPNQYVRWNWLMHRLKTELEPYQVRNPLHLHVLARSKIRGLILHLLKNPVLGLCLLYMPGGPSMTINFPINLLGGPTKFQINMPSGHCKYETAGSGSGSMALASLI